jgi:hypothetical protein
MEDRMDHLSFEYLIARSKQEKGDWYCCTGYLGDVPATDRLVPVEDFRKSNRSNESSPIFLANFDNRAFDSLEGIPA